MNQARIRTHCALALAAGLALTGCEREDAAGDALQKAHVKLTSLSPFGTAVAAPEAKAKAFNEVIASLKPALDGGTPTQAASASLLVAQSQLGLAEPHAAKAGELERSVLNDLTTIRSALGQYRAKSAGATAAAGYSPSLELEKIEKQSQEKTTQIAQEQAAKALVEKEVADLRAKSRAKQDESRARRQQAGSLRQQVATQSATQGEQTLIEAMKITREADALDVAAAQLEAQAASVEPRIVEVQNTIDRLTKQRDLLASERTDVMRRDQDAKKQAADLRADAAKTAQEIQALADKVHELRTGELAETTGKAASGFAQAAGSAKKAAAELKGGAQMIVGTAQHALADVHLSHARGLQVYSHVLESLALASPPLPGADTTAQRLTEAKTAMKEALDAAFEAYQAADAAYGSAGTTGEAKSRLERLNASFRTLVKDAGGSDDLIPARASEETPAAPEEAAATGGGAEAGTPQATLQALIDAGKTENYDAAMDLFLTNTDAEKQTIRSIMTLAPKWKKFDDLCKAKFGKNFTELAQSMGGGAAGGMGNMGGGMGLDSVNSASEIPVQIDGDTATATVPGGQPIVLKQRDGVWRVDLSEVTAQLGPMAPMLSGMSGVVDELTKDVEAGKFETFDQLMLAFGTKMQGLMGGMGGPGGG